MSRPNPYPRPRRPPLPDPGSIRAPAREPTSPPLPAPRPRTPKEQPPPSPRFAHAKEPTPPVPQTPPKDFPAFGTCLQSAHEAINKRHEDELRALESFRMHVFNRARADREYADQLVKINIRANRAIASVSQASPIVQAWSSYLEMCAAVQKKLNEGAAMMSNTLLQAVDQLIRDKRGAKKVFDTDRQRLEDEFHASTTAVQSLRREYQKYLQTTNNYKRKLEAANAKDVPLQKEQDKYRRKFVAQANKLHNCHNDYSLSLLNANAHQEHFRNSMHPFCLDTLQKRMEMQICEWKETLSQYAQATDLTQVYEETFRQFYELLKQVDKEEEYVRFIQENKQDQPAIELYEFDPSLLTEYCSPKVPAGQVVMNNLTHVNAKSRLEALERELEQHHSAITQKQEQLQAAMSEPDETSAPSSPGQQPPKHVRVAQFQAEIRELESFVARKKGQAHVIREAADAQGDSPPPIFDPLGEGVEAKDLETSVAGGGGGIGSHKHSMGGKMQATFQRGLGGLKGLGKKLKGKRNRVDSDNTSTGYARTGFPSMEHDEEEDGEGDNASDTSSIYDTPPEIPVEEEDWFYGDIDRRLAESKCKQPGDYIVRFSARAQKYVLTCNSNGTGKHFMIQQINSETGQVQYRFESKAFARLSDLLQYHVDTGTPVTRQSNAILLKSISKYDKWSLRHSEVKVGKKIGKGAFGDVFESTLSNGQRVAVKTCRSSDLQDVDKFLKEAEILKQYSHPNIVQLIGVCAEKDPIYIVMELMPGGSLLDFLRKKGSHQTRKKLCGMSLDACRGMEYLEQNNCIHRDLAARNCLVGENDSVKIADFGMSREEEGGIYTVQSGTRNIPIKWTAPEGLNYGKYTSSSDVWSYGILLWEVFSCGSAPYPGMSNQEARGQVDMGYRMSPPADCPESIYSVMSQCWQYEPEERPNFTQILEMLNRAYDEM